MPSELASAFDHLLKIVEQSQEYQEYLQLEKKLAGHLEIQKLIAEVKSLQKQLVQLEYRNQDTSEVEHAYQEKLSTLNGYPLYLEFVEKQKIVNETFQHIRQEIEFFLDELVLANVENS